LLPKFHVLEFFSGVGETLPASFHYSLIRDLGLARPRTAHFSCWNPARRAPFLLRP